MKISALTLVSALFAFAPQLCAASQNLRGENNDDRQLLIKLVRPRPFHSGDGTPDGETPADENICDQYTDNKANGLCIAFCEAKDCDQAIYQDNEGSIKSCQRIKDAFVAHTGIPSFPCERCPCWLQPQLSVITKENQAPERSCKDVIEDPDESRLIQKTSAEAIAVEDDVGFSVSARPGRNICIRITEVPNEPEVRVRKIILDDIRFDICRREIEDRCSDIGSPIPF